MSFNSHNDGKSIKRKTGLFGSIRDKLGRSKSPASSSPSSFSKGIPENAAPPAYTSTSPTSYNDAPAFYNNAAAANNTTSTSESYSPTPQNYCPTPQNYSPTSHSNNFASQQTSTVPQTIQTTPPHDLDSSPYALLSTFDTVLLIDDSGSMEWGSKPTPWKQVFSALQTIAPIITSYDADGIDVYFMNHKSRHMGNPSKGVAPTGYYNIQNAASVEEVWTIVNSPQGITPTGNRIKDILSPYMKRLKEEMRAGRNVKPLILIVITDGDPSDDPESEIVKVARQLDALDAPLTQVGIQFFQVGQVPQAKRALEDLDDALEHKYKIRDMVDTVTWNGRNSEAGLSGEGIVKAVLGSVIKRLDNKPASGEYKRS
ncbi:54b68b52-e71b-4543-b22c-a023d88c7cb6 [Sclerotinia trifoliorum]|uniref:54b68b52-e71b-4543-b22c-a023d88c7cb6 n=1 Tax=Sclerotinia trifoliorum TaxID=28548 RepID=A0A8H2VLK0_9HELO|nr:54b68b52-e71b-4543-b22c-a023d88c7cb6 [Sclerotinia trifoliorum]